MRDGSVDMNGEAAMAPGAHFINESLRDTLIIFEHSEYFFAEDDVSFGGIDIRERMEVVGRVKDAISNDAMDVGMPGEEIAKSLNREDEAWDKGFKREDSAKKVKDSFGSTLSQESEQFSITIEESAQNLRDSKDPLSVRDIMQDIVFNPVKPDEDSFLRTGRAEASCFTREGDEEIITALRTSYPRKPVFENSTIKILINSFSDDLS